MWLLIDGSWLGDGVIVGIIVVRLLGFGNWNGYGWDLLDLLDLLYLVVGGCSGDGEGVELEWF
jgi:hypothetical protein